VSVLAALAHEDHAVGLISDGVSERGRWSYIAARPDRVIGLFAGDDQDPFAALSDIVGPGVEAEVPNDPDLPPFQGGVMGLAAYELGARAEPVSLARALGWPDLVCARYLSILAFDHLHQRLFAIGRGPQARQAADMAMGWLSLSVPVAHGGRLAERFEEASSGAAYEANVATVVAKIAAGEIFQANIARPWVGRLRPEVTPMDLLSRLVANSPAPFAGYMKLPGLAVVSNSPERFIRLQPGSPRRIETRPIKGTRPRGKDGPATAPLLRRSAKA
jgi:para-aminobenzoate synthetase component 1